jgi:hypothetical protein
MSQLTIRTSAELVERVRAAASEHGMSINGWVTEVLDAATDPDREDDLALRVRAKLRAAGLLAGTGRSETSAPSLTEVRALVGSSLTADRAAAAVSADRR